MSGDRVRGAGVGGGLLFLALLLFVGYLVLEAVVGVLRFLMGTAFLAVMVVLALRVLRRR